MKVKRSKTFSGTPWESSIGYSRAVSVGGTVYVSGTTGTDSSGKILSPGNAYEQAAQSLLNVGETLKRFGLGLEHVVSTRIYLTDIDRWQEVAKAHEEVFGQVHPATSLVAVNRLLDPEMLVEIEAIAVN
jgi:enamine deaminase RidA (YjgF/YER057c/UK114 family)